MAQEVQIIDSNTVIGTHSTHKLDVPPERLVSEMDRCRISAGLTLSAIGVTHSYLMGNAATLAAARENNRLVPVATVNPIDYFGSASDMQAIRAQGFSIFKFYPSQQGWAIESASFEEILKQLAPLKVPIMIDAARPGEPSAVGRIAAGYPAPLVLCSVSRATLSEALALMAGLPNVVLETHELHVPGALELIAGRAGVDRIVFGSGAPRHSIAGSLQYVLSSELSDEEKSRVLGGNIRRILEAA